MASAQNACRDHNRNDQGQDGGSTMRTVAIWRRQKQSSGGGEGDRPIGLLAVRCAHGQNDRGKRSVDQGQSTEVNNGGANVRAKLITDRTSKPLGRHPGNEDRQIPAALAPSFYHRLFMTSILGPGHAPLRPTPARSWNGLASRATPADHVGFKDLVQSEVDHVVIDASGGQLLNVGACLIGDDRHPVVVAPNVQQALGPRSFCQGIERQHNLLDFITQAIGRAAADFDPFPGRGSPPRRPRPRPRTANASCKGPCSPHSGGARPGRD